MFSSFFFFCELRSLDWIALGVTLNVLMWYNPFKPCIFDGQILKLLPQLYHFKMII